MLLCLDSSNAFLLAAALPEMHGAAGVLLDAHGWLTPAFGSENGSVWTSDQTSISQNGAFAAPLKALVLF